MPRERKKPPESREGLDHHAGDDAAHHRDVMDDEERVQAELEARMAVKNPKLHALLSKAKPAAKKKKK